MTIEVWNRKRLPLAWLRADDDASFGVVVRERELVDGSRGSGALRNVWTLAPFERVTRRFHVGAERRGVYDLGPVDLVCRRPVRPPGGRPRSATTATRFIVRPRTVGDGRHRATRTSGAALERAKAGLTEDPSRFAGVRPYAPGDPLRRDPPPGAAPASGPPVTKRFEPSRDREVLIVLDVQTDARAGLGDRLRARRRRGAVRRRRVARPVAGAASGRRSGIAAAGFTGAESALRPRPDLVVAAARPSGSSTCWPGSRRTPRRRSSGCSRSSAGSPGRGRRSSS